MNNFKLSIINLIIFALIIRVVTSFLPSFEIDLIGWRSWAMRMVEVGPSNFYSNEVFTDNPPGFLYVFWLIGAIKTFLLPTTTNNLIFDFLLKLPTNIADILSALIIYKLIKIRLSEKLALLGFTLYAFNPITIFNSAIWGQFDGSATLFLLLALYAFFVKRAPRLTAFSFALAWAIKPQAIAFAPVLGLLFLSHTKPSTWISSGTIFILTTLLLYLPFFPKDSVGGFIQVQKAMTGIFYCTTCFAFNFWGIFGNWQNDLQKFVGIPLFAWGLILLFITFIPIFFLKPFDLKFKPPYFYLTAAISIMAFFIFLTRMHERYLFPVFPFILLAALMLRSRILIGFYILVSCLHLLNLYISYAYYNNLVKITNLPIKNLFENFSSFSLITFLSFLLLFIYYLIYVKRNSIS